MDPPDAYPNISKSVIGLDLSTCQLILLSSLSLKFGCYSFARGVHESICALLKNRGTRVFLCNFSKHRVLRNSGSQLTSTCALSTFVTTEEDPPRKYIGSTGGFKARYTSHMHTFRTENLKTSSTLSHHVWDKNL